MVKWPYWNFQKGGPYEFSPKFKKQLFGVLLDELHLEIMLDDHLVTKLAFLDYKKSLFSQVALLEFFQRGDPMNLVQN